MIDIFYYLFILQTANFTILNNMREHINDFETYKGEKYFKPIGDNIRNIKDLISRYDKIPNDDFLQQINFYSEQMIEDFSLLKKIHHNDTKKLLEIIIDFLNKFLETFELKRFYNLTPSISYQDYTNLPIWEQIINNVFDWKINIIWPCLIKKKYIRGWNCHHRSIAIKKIFDKINLEWVECHIDKVPWWHSFIVIEQGSRVYMLDMTEHWKVLWLKDMMIEWWINAHKVLNPEQSDLMEFKDSQKFAKLVDSAKHNTIKLQIDKIKLEVEHWMINIEITKWNKVTKRNFKISLDNDKNSYTKKELLEKFFPRIEKIIPIVWKKIMKEHLMNVLNRS